MIVAGLLFERGSLAGAQEDAAFPGCVSKSKRIEGEGTGGGVGYDSRSSAVANAHGLAKRAALKDIEEKAKGADLECDPGCVRVGSPSLEPRSVEEISSEETESGDANDTEGLERGIVACQIGFALIGEPKSEAECKDYILKRPKNLRYYALADGKYSAIMIQQCMPKTSAVFGDETSTFDLR